MGDRTFTAEDVIRIYDFYLDDGERQTVEEFFAGEPEESQLPTVSALLTLLENLLSVLSGFRIGALAITFGALTSAALQLAIARLRATNLILGNILAAEEVDA